MSLITYIGITSIQEQPESPVYEANANGIRGVERRYRGLYTALLSYTVPTMDASFLVPFEGIRIQSEPGGWGTMAIRFRDRSNDADVLSVGGNNLIVPSTQYGLQGNTLERSIRQHPNFAGLTSVATNGTTYEIPIVGTAQCPGVESYLVGSACYVKRSYSTSWPTVALSELGKRSAPGGPGPSSSSTTAWLKTADEVHQIQPNLFERTQTWIAAEGGWNTNIYGT